MCCLNQLYIRPDLCRFNSFSFSDCDPVITWPHTIKLTFLVNVKTKSTRAGRVFGAPVSTNICGLQYDKCTWHVIILFYINFLTEYKIYILVNFDRKEWYLFKTIYKITWSFWCDPLRTVASELTEGHFYRHELEWKIPNLHLKLYHIKVNSRMSEQNKTSS